MILIDQAVSLDREIELTFWTIAKYARYKLQRKTYNGEGICVIGRVETE